MGGVTRQVAGMQRGEMGKVTTAALQVNFSVTFKMPMPDTTYVVLLSRSGVAVNVSGVTKRTTGFDVNLTVSLGAGTVYWAALPEAAFA